LRKSYHANKSCDLSLADCFLIGAATSVDEIATADEPVARVARSEGIEVVPFPSSSGSRP
jgi:predicted nucleic acid-binding protein